MKRIVEISGEDEELVNRAADTAESCIQKIDADHELRLTFFVEDD